MLGLWLLACGDGEPERDRDRVRECDTRGDHRVVVIQKLWFVREEGGVSEGFDLDGVETPLGGPEGCGIADLVAPDGSTGIDNAFAYLLPALELTEAQAVEGLIQQAINDGQLLVTYELDELDDPLDDACVDVTIGRGTGVPMVGTDGLLLSGQTIDRDLDAPTFHADALPLVEGTFESPFEIVLPVQIFDVSLEFQLLGGRLRGTLDDDGTLVGVFAGGVDIEYLLSIARNENVDSALEGILASLLSLWADLAPDETGACTQVSIAFGFEAVPVFFYED